MRSISESETTQPDSEIERLHALEILAYHNQWPAAVHGMMHWLASSPADLRDAFLSHPPLSEAILAPAIAEDSAEESPSPGSVRVLGFAGYSPLTPRVRFLLASTRPESELALACVVNLGLCRDDTIEAATLLASQLGVGEHRYQARLALLRIGNPTSIDALLADLRDQFDLSLAIQLAHRIDSEQRAIELIKTHMAGLSSPRLEDALDGLLTRDQELIVRLLGDAKIRNRLRESSFSDEGYGRHIFGAKARAIRALGLFDRDAAKLAAIRTFQNMERRDRELYPDLIVEFSDDQAVDILVKQAAIEKSTLVIWSIAEALEGLVYADALASLLKSTELDQRLTGCRLSERIRLPDSILRILRALTEDLENAVVNAACRALKFQRDAQTADALMEAVRKEQDLSRRWIFIDALLSVCFPSVANRPFPKWVNELFGRSPYFERHHVQDRLEARRKELAEEAKKRDEK